MSQETIERLQARVDQLEQKVSQLEKEIEKLTPPPVMLLKPPPVVYAVQSSEDGERTLDDGIGKGILTFDGKTFKVIDGDWTHKKIRAFMFEDNIYEVKSGKDFFVKFFEILSKDKSLQFRKVLELSEAFNENPDTFPPSVKLVDIMKIGKTGIYFNALFRDHEGNQKIISSIVKHLKRDMPVPLETAD